MGSSELNCVLPCSPGGAEGAGLGDGHWTTADRSKTVEAFGGKVLLSKIKGEVVRVATAAVCKGDEF
jgi:hypothetical protein